MDKVAVNITKLQYHTQLSQSLVNLLVGGVFLFSTSVCFLNEVFWAVGFKIITILQNDLDHMKTFTVQQSCSITSLNRSTEQLKCGRKGQKLQLHKFDASTASKTLKSEYNKLPVTWVPRDQTRGQSGT